MFFGLVGRISCQHHGLVRRQQQEVVGWFYRYLGQFQEVVNHLITLITHFALVSCSLMSLYIYSSTYYLVCSRLIAYVVEGVAVG